MAETCKESVVVVGAGVVGLTTAYQLSTKYRVTVVESKGEVCQGASFQNGGVVNVESIAPVNSYMNLWSTLRASAWSLMTGQPTNSIIRPSILAEHNLFQWLWHFLENSSKERILHNSEGMRQMGAAIAPLVEEMFADLGMDRTWHNFHYTPGLLLSRVADPEKTVATKQELFDQVHRKQYVIGAELERVKRESGILGLEEADHNLGCVEPHNLTLNTARLGASLRSRLEERGVSFIMGKEARLAAEGSRVVGVEVDGETLVADNYVVCAGYNSLRILRNLGLNIPLLPIKAYSLHINNCPAAENWRYAAHIDSTVAGLFTPYRQEGGASLRVTGIRDLEGSDPSPRSERVTALTECAQRFAGQEWTDKDVTVWSGVMPLSPDDFPVIGRTARFANLFINCGHGFRGTAYSLPSARLLLQLMQEEKKTCFDPKFANPARFGL